MPVSPGSELQKKKGERKKKREREREKKIPPTLGLWRRESGARRPRRRRRRRRRRWRRRWVTGEDGGGGDGGCRNRTKKKWKSCNLHGLLAGQHSPALDVFAARERRQAIEIRSFSLSLSLLGSVKGYYVPGPPSRFSDRFVE